MSKIASLPGEERVVTEAGIARPRHIRRPVSRCMAALPLLAIVTPAIAQQADVWRMNGVQLLAALKGEAAPEIADVELRRQVSFERGAAYVAGVADATDGKLWCMEGGILIHELTDRVFTELQTLSPEALAQNAAIPVAAALSKSFPCKDQ